MSATEVRENFVEVINRVAYGDERVVRTRHGKALVALVPIDDLDAQLADEAWDAYQREGGVPVEVIRQKLDAAIAREGESTF
ncbi:MAG: type II toxin-antitoxin system Phd/YefM family antitoxin [Thermomicrobiales bacterium]|nr:type II toxin-antitoxin system Phd/YefM family antitoxin [Thermomicrobiales bacterium]